MYEKIDGCGRGKISVFGPYKMEICGLCLPQSPVGYRREFMCYFYEILQMSYRD